VLLALAQAKEPSQYLDSLFACSPLLAAAAVAECATPAVSAQEQAIHACLRGIDAGEESARSAALALLRKVRGIQEEKFITSLESRLGTGPHGGGRGRSRVGDGRHCCGNSGPGTASLDLEHVSSGCRLLK